jgi:hypothetical protein
MKKKTVMEMKLPITVYKGILALYVKDVIFSVKCGKGSTGFRPAITVVVNVENLLLQQQLQ